MWPVYSATGPNQFFDRGVVRPIWKLSIAPKYGHYFPHIAIFSTAEGDLFLRRLPVMTWLPPHRAIGREMKDKISQARVQLNFV